MSHLMDALNAAIDLFADRSAHMEEAERNRLPTDRAIHSIFGPSSLLDSSLFSPATNTALRTQHSLPTPGGIINASHSITVSSTGRIDEGLREIDDLLMSINRNLSSEDNTANAEDVPIIDLSDSPIPLPRRLRGIQADVVTSNGLLDNSVVDLCSPDDAQRRVRRTTRSGSRLLARVSARNRRSLENQSLEDGSDRVVCPVCLEKVYKRHPTTTKCGHVFCRSCIEQVMRVKPLCPICQQKVNRSSLIRLYW